MNNKSPQSEFNPRVIFIDSGFCTINLYSNKNNYQAWVKIDNDILEAFIKAEFRSNEYYTLITKISQNIISNISTLRDKYTEELQKHPNQK